MSTTKRRPRRTPVQIALDEIDANEARLASLDQRLDEVSSQYKKLNARRKQLADIIEYQKANPILADVETTPKEDQ